MACTDPEVKISKVKVARLSKSSGAAGVGVQVDTTAI